MADNVKKIETKDDFEAFLNSKSVVVADFYADWCGPCRAMAPKIEKMAGELSAVGFCKINVDEVEELSEQYQVEALPTFIVFVDGKEVEKVVGASEAKVREAVMKHNK